MSTVSSTPSNTLHLIARLVGCIALLATFQGCQFAPQMPTAKWPWSKKPAPIPDRLLAVWSDSVLHQPGLPGVRGFGGRVYFYQAPETDPIKVDGAVAVYIFDADQTEPVKQQPLRKYVFTAEQLNDHMSKTSIGPSYSLWLPWDEVGGTSRRLSLITRFEATQGGTVISDPAIKLLPGIPVQNEEKSPSDLAQVHDPKASGSPSNINARLVVVQQTQEPVVTADQLNGRGIHTIDLPPSFQQHIRRDSPAPTSELLKPPQQRQQQIEPPQTPVGQPWVEAAGLPQSAAVGGAAVGGTDQDVVPASGSYTKVFDSRSRQGYQPNSGYHPKTSRDRDIRQGRWIESPRPRTIPKSEESSTVD